MRTRARWVVLAVSVAVFLLLAALLVFGTSLAALDLRITQFLQQQRTPALTRAMLFLSDSHETVRMLAAAVLLGLWRYWRRDRAGALSLAVVPLGELLNLGLKRIFQRPRPEVPEPLVHLGTYSFPSGHAVASTLFYGAVCALVLQRVRSRPARIATVLACIVMVVLVAFSRVYLGAHYTSDVLAGIAVGAACVALVLRPLPATAALAPGP